MASLTDLEPGQIAARPYLLSDTVPEQRERFERCCSLGEQMRARAAAEWSKEFGTPEKPVGWPLQMDGVNCRAALRAAQLLDPAVKTIAHSLKWALNRPSVPMPEGEAVVTKKELAEYRLNPHRRRCRKGK